MDNKDIRDADINVLGYKGTVLDELANFKRLTKIVDLSLTNEFSYCVKNLVQIFEHTEENTHKFPHNRNDNDLRRFALTLQFSYKILEVPNFCKLVYFF